MGSACKSWFEFSKKKKKKKNHKPITKKKLRKGVTVSSIAVQKFEAIFLSHASVCVWVYLCDRLLASGMQVLVPTSASFVCLGRNMFRFYEPRGRCSSEEHTHTRVTKALKKGGHQTLSKRGPGFEFWGTVESASKIDILQALFLVCAHTEKGKQKKKTASGKINRKHTFTDAKQNPPRRRARRVCQTGPESGGWCIVARSTSDERN